MNSTSPGNFGVSSSTTQHTHTINSVLAKKDPMIQGSPTVKQMQSAEVQGVKVSIGEEQLIRSIDRALRTLQGPTTSFEISVHEQTKAITVKVIDKDTGELIREVPPEKTLDLVAKLMEFAGILVDERV